MMNRTRLSVSGLGLAAGGMFIAPAIAQPTIDGTADAMYGSEVVVQDTQTGFGDSNLGLVDFANGSELDGLYAMVADGVLYMVLSGNLESNFNKLEIFIDSRDGGQNQLRGDNPDVDFNGLNRMGDDPDTAEVEGLIFDQGFEADFWLGVTGGNDPYELYASYAELRTASDQGIGAYLGMGGAVTDGTLSGGDNFPGILVTINNSNVLGVTGGNGLDNGAGVPTGVELAIPLSAIGNPTSSIAVVAFVNGFGHDFVSNQVLAGIGGGDNLGDPRFVDLSAISGDQFATVTFDPGAVPFTLEVAPIVAGANALMRTTHGTPNTAVYYGYSLDGLGETPIPPLGVVVDLTNPAEIGRTRSNASGVSSFSKFVPAVAQGRRVYIQAVENGDTTNVVAKVVN